MVETTNFNGLVGHTSAGVPGSPGPLQPETPNMKTVERFTRVANDTIEFRMTISDPTVLATSSYTIEYPMYLNNSYLMFEYACHGGSTAIRNYIETSRYERSSPQREEGHRQAVVPARWAGMAEALKKLIALGALRLLAQYLDEAGYFQWFSIVAS